jgi:formyltetrahydrofolate synthetase
MMRKAATNMTMPNALEISLTTHPAAEHMDIDADGRIVGLW